MEQIIDLLHQGNYSCVIRNGDEIRTFTQRGVADLYALLGQEPSFMEGAFIADKVVGKGAAALMILGGISRVYADVVSQSAFDLFTQAKVEVSFGQIVPFIQNRTKTGWCPVETLCMPAATAQEVLPLIEVFLSRKPV